MIAAPPVEPLQGIRPWLIELADLLTMGVASDVLRMLAERFRFAFPRAVTA
jgi:hypothetical protein